MNIGLLEVDNNDCIILANNHFSQMSGYSPDFLVGKKASELFLTTKETVKLQSKQFLREKGISDSYELCVKIKNDENRVWLISGAPNYNLNGEVIGSIGLHFDVTELKKLENLKQSLLEKLEKQNEQLLDYAQIVSHDLKSPLRSIHALITFIKEDSEVVFNEKTNKYFNLIQEKTEKMDFLIQGILSYSKVENSDINKENIDLNNLVNSIEKIIFIPSNFKIIIKNKLPVINNDYYRMQQLFQNMISNAINYNNKTNGFVEISSEESDNYHVFAIKDNGIGIEKKNQKKIFEMFQTFNSDYKSSGIGLSIVKRIIKNANGKIWIESEKDLGTTFFFTLQK
jgi:PAS domain S-box-containing protein